MRKGSPGRPVALALILIIAWGLGFELTTDFDQSDAGLGWGVLFMLGLMPAVVILLVTAVYRFIKNQKK